MRLPTTTTIHFFFFFVFFSQFLSLWATPIESNLARKDAAVAIRSSAMISSNIAYQASEVLTKRKPPKGPEKSSAYKRVQARTSTTLQDGYLYAFSMRTSPSREHGLFHLTLIVVHVYTNTGGKLDVAPRMYHMSPAQDKRTPIAMWQAVDTSQAYKWDYKGRVSSSYTLDSIAIANKEMEGEFGQFSKTRNNCIHWVDMLWNKIRAH